MANILGTRKNRLYIGGVPVTPDDIKLLPAYTLDEASRYIGMSKSTMQIWFRGRHEYLTKKGRKHNAVSPILHSDSGARQPISFIDLIEAHVLTTVRKGYKIPVKNIRSAAEYLKVLNKNLTFLAHEDFYHDHKHLFLKIEDLLISLSERGQVVDKDIIEKGLTQIKYGNDGFADKFFPRIGDTIQHDFVLDPHINYGKLSIARLGVGADIISTRFDSGEDILEIASDYGAEQKEVEEAIRWNRRLAA